MALVFADGWDHYPTASLNKKWTKAGGTVNATGGRRNGGYLSGPGTSAPGKTLTSQATWINGFALYLGGGGGNSVADWTDTTASGVQLQLQVFTDGRVGVLRGGNGAGYGPPSGTLLGASAGPVFPFSSWNYIEWKVTIHPTAGSVEVRVNSKTVLLLTNVNTRNTANSSANQFNLGGPGGTSWIDDLYICDATGTTNNDFLGDIRIDPLYANADGTYSQYVPTPAGTHYTTVDETSTNTTDYVESSTVGERDSYAFQDLPAGTGAILGVQTVVAALKNDAGARNVKNLVKSGATVAVSAAQAVTSTQLFYPAIFETDPNTGAGWTRTNLNAAEFGIETA